MKGIILAGGMGTRLLPITEMVNKHLLPVGRYPMIYYSLKKLSDAGIKEIILIIGKQSTGLYTEFLGSGTEWGVHITYIIQEEAKGIAHALALAGRFIDKNEKFVTILGDNLFEDPLDSYMEKYWRQDQGAMVLIKEVTAPHRYGVPCFVRNNIISIEEKPAIPKSSYCVTGIYFYDSEVFEVIKQMKPSKRGELEITDVNNAYADQGQLSYSIMQGWWIDAGTFHSLHEANTKLLYFQDNLQRPQDQP